MSMEGKEAVKTCKKLFSIACSACILLVFGLCLAVYINGKIPAFYTISADTDEVEATFSSSWDGSEDYPFVEEETGVTEELSAEYGTAEEAEKASTEATAEAAAESEEVSEEETAEAGEHSAAEESGEAVSYFDRFTGPVGKAINLARAVKARFVTLTTNWTTRVTTSNPLYYVSVYVNKYFDKLCGYNLTTSVSATNDTLDASDIVVELEDGYLGRVLDADSIETYGLDNVESLVAFGLSMEEDGRNFLYAALPEKIELSDYDGTISAVYENYYPEMTQIALSALEEAGLDSLYMVSAMEKDGMDSVTSFYETDHHWRATTGLYACGVLGETLNDLYGYAIDTSIFDQENYTITTLEDQWIGSLGWKVTTVYHDLEDIEIIIPDYETDLEVYRSNTNSTYFGTIDETLFNWSYLTGGYNVLSYNPYAFYGYGDLAFISVHNNLVDDGSNVLILKTSYIDSVAPFFAASVENLYVLDLRHFTGCVEDLIEDIDPDTVVVMYNTSAFASENAWDHTNLFDFR